MTTMLQIKQERFVKHWPPAHSRWNTLPRLWKPRLWNLGYPETIYALMNVECTWWKATQKVLAYYLHLTQCMLLESFLNGHHLIFCSPDSYNPCNSCWNKHCYIIMHLSVACHSGTCIYRMQVCVVKGYPKWFWIITLNSATRYMLLQKF